jgi:hypothetical protein
VTQSLDAAAGNHVNVIDLDEPVAQRERPSRHRWRGAAVAGALLLVGALIGGLLTHARDVARQGQRSRSTVSAVVLATRNPAEPGTPHRVAGMPWPAPVTADVQVTIVNAGPAAINVPRLSGVQRGVTLSITDKQRWIDPGTSTTADAVVTVTCAVGYPLGDLKATLSVVTVDDALRLLPVQFAADPWNAQLDEQCR